MTEPESVTVPTPDGPGRLLVHPASGRSAGVLVLGHGAGGGSASLGLMALARALPDAGITVCRYEQPWLVAGRKVGGPPSSLDRGWLPALAAVRALGAGTLFVGGRSAGARVACRTVPPDAAGLVLVSFPLHPPGRPQQTRIGELAGAASDAVIVQGERDPWGSPAEIEAAVASVPQGGQRIIHGVEGTHSFEPRTKAAREAAPGLAGEIAAAVLAFVRPRLAVPPAV